MKALQVVALVGLLGLCAALAGAEGPDRGAPSSLGAVRSGANRPLADPGRGRLYDSVGQMLNAARGLPESIDLGLPPGQAQPEAAAARPQRKQQAPPDLEIKPAPKGQKGWVAVFEKPIADPRELARAHYLAGSYREAAKLYGALLEGEPENEHLLVMLALSERNAGAEERARELLGRLAGQDTPAGQWAGWTLQMMSLSEAEPEEGE